MNRSLGIAALAAALLLPILAGCGGNSTSGPGFGTMNVRMTDDPGDYDQVNIVVTQVSARLEDSDAIPDSLDDDDDADGGWVVLENETHTYDLIALQNGTFVTIGSELIPAGRYTQIRLKIGTGSNIVVDGVTHPLKVPSGAQSGLKINGIFDVPVDGLIGVDLDFDASRSIVLNGAGEYHLKPVIRGSAAPAAGAITGLLSPAGVAASIDAWQGADTLGTARAALDGRFTIAVLPGGQYSVTVRPDSGYRDTTFAGVPVTPGATWDMGTIQLTAE